MEVTSRKPLLEKHDNLEIRKKPPRQLATKRKCGRKAIACIGSVLLAVFIQLIVYALLGQYVFMKTPIDVDLTEAEKCPACTGQSSCPVFFRGEVFVPAFQYTKLKQGHPTPAGVEATIGLYEASKRLNLRRMGSPATADTVDNAVCRRGLPHGYAEASDYARSKIRCIPHLSIWRWRPTNSPEMSGFSESVETPLHRGLVAAPSYLSQDNASTEVASDQTMLTAFSPAVRCASDRLFSHLLSSFRERTSVGAETRWLRFDELMFLFNLAVDPQPLLWQAFPRSKHWPLPAYTGACGRWTLQDYHGVPLERFCGAPLWLRLRILSSILKIPELLQHVSSSATSSQSDGYAIYLGNFHLGSLFTVDPITYNVTVANLRHSIVVDVDTAIKYNQESDFTIPLEATDYVISHFPSHQCDGNLSSTGDSGGSTPPCLSTEHADNLCTHSSSDHNYWAICTALLHGWSPSDTCSRFLDDMPAELMDALRRCVADTRPRSRRVDVREAQRIVDHLIEEHVEPFAWWPM